MAGDISKFEHVAKKAINNVAPLPEVSWIRPLISFLYSTFTGITYLPLLVVTMFSWRYFESPEIYLFSKG